MPIKKGIRILKWTFSKFAVRNTVITIGIVINVIWNFSNQRKSYRQDLRIAEQDTLIKSVQLENLELRRINNDIVTSNVYGSKMLHKVKNPLWYKVLRGKRGGIMQFTNTAFDKAYLKPKGLSKFDYYGNNDFAVFTYEPARLFAISDSLAAHSDVPIKVTEDFKDENGVMRKLISLKWREIEGKDTLVWGEQINFYK